MSNHLMPNPPLLSSEIEPPEILGWFHKLSGFLGEAVTITREPLTSEQYARYAVTATVESGQAVSLANSERFAMHAVHAEQDLVTARLDHCAELVASHINEDENCKKLANEILDELATLRKLVNRGRAGQGFWDKPNWWNRTEDIDPALMLMRSARARRGLP